MSTRDVYWDGHRVDDATLTTADSGWRTGWTKMEDDGERRNVCTLHQGDGGKMSVGTRVGLCQTLEKN